MKRVLVVFGTRPEAIKMAPVVKELQSWPDKFETRICVTAQHRSMLDQVMDFFEMTADYDLDIMTHDQTLYSITASIIGKMKDVFDDALPDYVLVHGDTTTAMATSLATFYFRAKLCHIEAGLRTYDKQAPFPEEMNRVLTADLANLHFAPTAMAKQNLIKESIDERNIYVTGNTVIDALLYSVAKVKHHQFESIRQLEALPALQNGKDIVLLTIHRRENHGENLEKICAAILEIRDQANVQFIYPVHPNPNVYNPVHQLLGNQDNILLIEPQPYEAFVWLMDKAKLIITDSGGIQEEAPSLGKPVLVLRTATERPESVDAGTVIMVGCDQEKIVLETLDLLTNTQRYEQMSQLKNPYGDGTAASQIVARLM